ncbi:hypothetical protein Tco_0352222 [Tanacetum coccineum]
MLTICLAASVATQMTPTQPATNFVGSSEVRSFIEMKGVKMVTMTKEDDDEDMDAEEDSQNATRGQKGIEFDDDEDDYNRVDNVVGMQSFYL